LIHAHGPEAAQQGRLYSALIGGIPEKVCGEAQAVGFDLTVEELDASDIHPGRSWLSALARTALWLGQRRPSRVAAGTGADDTVASPPLWDLGGGASDVLHRSEDTERLARNNAAIFPQLSAASGTVFPPSHERVASSSANAETPPPQHLHRGADSTGRDTAGEISFTRSTPGGPCRAGEGSPHDSRKTQFLKEGI
jgi:hypothetical protein